MRQIGIGLCLVLLVIFGSFVRGSHARPQSRVFSETGYTVREPFLSFWRQGGVERFGYPISPEFQEANPDDGNIYTVQYFERTRLEHHPGAATPVQIGRLGAQRLAGSQADLAHSLPPAAGALATQIMSAIDADCLTFPQTGQQLCGIFAEYWQANGGVAMFGYPLTAPVMHRADNGRLLVAQYTERARLEIDPASQVVSLGLLGRESYTPQPGMEPPDWARDPTLARLITLINQVRAEAGLAPLAPAPELMAAAQEHSLEMAMSGFISHTGPDGRTAPQRMRDAGYAWLRCGENIAVSQPTPELAVQFWMNSPPHRANILDPGMREVGVGYVRQEAGYGHYWTMTLGER